MKVKAGAGVDNEVEEVPLNTNEPGAFEVLKDDIGDIEVLDGLVDDESLIPLSAIPASASNVPEVVVGIIDVIGWGALGPKTEPTPSAEPEFCAPRRTVPALAACFSSSASKASCSEGPGNDPSRRGVYRQEWVRPRLTNEFLTRSDYSH